MKQHLLKPVAAPVAARAAPSSSDDDARMTLARHAYPSKTRWRVTAGSMGVTSACPMCGWSCDMFFAPENPGIKLYHDDCSPFLRFRGISPFEIRPGALGGRELTMP